MWDNKHPPTIQHYKLIDLINTYIDRMKRKCITWRAWKKHKMITERSYKDEE